jgi:hypothetical protein
LRERTITIASGGRDAVETYDEMADRFNKSASFWPSITGDQLKEHSSCPPQEVGMTALETALPPAVREVVVVGGETLPVYSAAETVRIICAVAVRNIIEHPEQVKVGHLVSIMKMTGDLKKSDDLVQLVMGLIQNPQAAPRGPQSPPE